MCVYNIYNVNTYINIHSHNGQKEDICEQHRKVQRRFTCKVPTKSQKKF